MRASLDWRGRKISVDFSRGQSLAIPLDPHGPQPSFFADEAASAAPLRSGDYIGDVHKGGSCNAEVICFTPHCHGTHTECAGHISRERLSVLDTIYAGPTLAVLMTASAAPAIALEDLRRRASALTGAGCEALIIRTEPNGPGKTVRNYARESEYPVLAGEAMGWLASLPLKHLLLDTPSLDAPHDDRLSNHRAWWSAGGASPEGIDPARRSVTEMIWAPDGIADGLYWLHLELAPLVSDATPSRPMIYPVEGPMETER